MAGLRVPLSTLRPHRYRYVRMTRGRGDWLGLPRTALSSATPRRFSTAHCPSVFISYSHQDEDWKDRLVTHLGVLQKQEILEIWDDRKIDSGDEWYLEIQRALEAAKVAVLLVSANSLTSNFI